MSESSSNRYRTAFVLVCLLVVAIMVGAVLWPPVIFDTFHFDDVIFLTNLGWRSYLGGVPTVDFNDFLGGVTARSVALAISLFGPSAKVVEYANLLLALGVLAVLYAVSWRRLDVLATLLLTALIVTLMLTRTPTEMSVAIFSVQSGHSYPYNRLGTCIAVVLSVFAVAKGGSRAQEIAVGLLCGATLYVLFLTKPTFLVFAPAYLFALLVVRRGAALVGSLAGLALALIAIDPAAAHLGAAFRYAQEQMPQRLSILDSLEKAAQLVAAQLVAGFVAAGSVVACLVEGGRRFVRPMLGIAALLGGGLGLALTMGGPDRIGHQLLPFLVITPLLVFLVIGDRVRRLKLVAFFFPFCLILPHVGNMAASSMRAHYGRHLGLIESGPLANYIAYDWSFLTELREHGLTSRESIFALADSLLEDGEWIDNGIEYAVFAEGLEQLESIPDVETLGIVTNGRMFDFSFALGSPPVLTYPAFPETSSPELRSTAPLGPEVDIVMIADFEDHDMVTDQVFVKMADLYELCRESRHWRLYTRKGNDIRGCSGDVATTCAGQLESSGEMRCTPSLESRRARVTSNPG